MNGSNDDNEGFDFDFYFLLTLFAALIGGVILRMSGYAVELERWLGHAL